MKKLLLSTALIAATSCAFSMSQSNNLPEADLNLDAGAELIKSLPIEHLVLAFPKPAIKGSPLKDGDSIKVSSTQLNQIFVPDNDLAVAPITVLSKNGDIEYAVDRNILYVIPTVKTPVKVFIHTTSGPVGITLIPSPMIQSITATIIN